MAQGGATGSVVADRGPFDRMWWIAIGGAGAMILSLALAWSSLPDPIAVQWATGGEVTNTLSKLLWALLWIGAWVLLSSSLVALRTPFDWRRMLVTAILGILTAGYITTLENNWGAASAGEVERLDLLPAVVLAFGASVAVWWISRSLAR